MEYFYDGQIRRYITQVIRVFSNFVVKYGDGTLVQIPVMYGDPDRQVANILSQNSLGNKVNSSPRIAVYITSLALDRDRLADATYIGKVHIRERDTQIDNVPGSPTYGQLIYNEDQGRQYTVERIMPTPFKLTFKVDMWASNTEQKLQMMEQLLVLFNPSLELQTNDNYIDWTSLSVLNLNDISWSSRQVPVGNDTPIDIATLTLETPIWISPPAKVKRLGVVTNIIASLFNHATLSNDSYIEGLGTDPEGPTTVMAGPIEPDTSLNGQTVPYSVWGRNTDPKNSIITSAGSYQIQVYGNSVTLLGPNESVTPLESTLEITLRQGSDLDWNVVFAGLTGKYLAGSSTIYLLQPNGTYVIGTFAINPVNPGILTVNWNPDTLTANTGIDSSGILERHPGYNPSSYRNGQTGSAGSPGTFDAIINPLTYDPLRPQRQAEAQSVTAGARFLIIEDIGNILNPKNTGPEAWRNSVADSNGNYDFVAYANDIIEWNGEKWNIIFNASQNTSTMIWQTNIYTGVQYLWNGVSWNKSFEGEYSSSKWKIVL